MNYKKYAKSLEDVISRVYMEDDTRIVVNHMCLLLRDEADDNITRYIRVEWPEYQYFMNHPKWNDCLLTDDNAYMIPEEIYEEVTENIYEDVIAQLTPQTHV